MRVIVSAVLMACTLSANATEATADTNLTIGANTILAKFNRVTAVLANEVPNVDRSLAIGARSILGIFPRQTQVEPGNVPNVDVARNGFIQGVMNRQAGDQQRAPAQHVTADQGVVIN